MLNPKYKRGSLLEPKDCTVVGGIGLLLKRGTFCLHSDVPLRPPGLPAISDINIHTKLNR